MSIVLLNTSLVSTRYATKHGGCSSLSFPRQEVSETQRTSDVGVRTDTSLVEAVRTGASVAAACSPDAAELKSRVRG